MFLFNAISADTLMILPESRDAPFGPYAQIRNQAPNQQQEANIVNQQKLKGANEPRVDLLPCRAAPVMDNPHAWTRGQVIEFQNQWNNPHASFCELNLVRQDGNATTVYQVVEPTECGGGFTRQGFNFNIPSNFPKCDKGQCFLQYYAYSLEPRDYVTCSDFTISDDPPSSALQMKPFKVYHDGEDFDKVSNDYNPYRGQADPIPFIISAIWNLKNFGEVGDKAVELKVLTQEQYNLKQQMKGISANMRDTLEANLRPALLQNKDVLQAKTLGTPMGDKKGNANSQGYYPPIEKESYNPGIKYYGVNALSSKLQATILSKPADRETTTTYIPLPDNCIKSGLDTVAQYNASLANKAPINIGALINNAGLKCADELGLSGINAAFYKALMVMAAKRKAATGYDDPKNQWNVMLFSNSGTLRTMTEIVVMILAI